MIEFRSDLKKLPETDDVGGGQLHSFFINSERTIRIEGEKAALDLPRSRRAKLSVACREYCELEDRAAKRGMARMSHFARYGSSKPFDGKTDSRSKKKQLLDAIEKIIECVR
jgi:hypothetical protein